MGLTSVAKEAHLLGGIQQRIRKRGLVLLLLQKHHVSQCRVTKHTNRIDFRDGERNNTAYIDFRGILLN